MMWELPVVALGNIVIMPAITMNIDVGRPKSKRAVDEAQSSDRRVLLLTQRDARTDDPTRAELYEMGVLAVLLIERRRSKQEVETSITPTGN